MLENFSIGAKFTKKKEEEGAIKEFKDKEVVRVAGINYSIVKYMTELGSNLIRFLC